MAENATRPATPAAVADADALAHTAMPEGVRTPNEAEPRLAAGEVIADRYRIARVLGEGGMGVVYAAEHVLMRKEVAVKVLHAEMCSIPEVVARFEREAIAAAHIEHPNVAGATDFGRLPDGSCYLVLELLKGTSLRDEIARGPIPLARAAQILRGIASGVGAAHALGVIHRDLKPENVMLVERDGQNDFVKVLDFGIAKLDTAVASPSGASKPGGAVLTRMGAVFGTPEYMAPEQAIGDTTVDARADLYALGVIFLEMLTGSCPFQGNALSILRQRILAVEPPDMSTVADERARAIIARLLERQPSSRMGSAGELVRAIDELIGGERTSGSLLRPSASLVATPSSPSPLASAATNPPRPAALSSADEGAGRRRWWLVGVAALVGIVLGVVAVVSLAAPGARTAKAEASRAPGPPTSTTAAPPSAAPATAEAPVEVASSEPDKDPDPPPAPAAAPTGSAASARAIPRRPSPRPRTQKKGSAPLNIPPPDKWFK